MQKSIFQGAPLRFALACGARKGLVLSVPSTYEPAWRKNYATLARSFASLEDRLYWATIFRPLPGLVFRWFEYNGASFHLPGFGCRANRMSAQAPSGWAFDSHF
jgi:hypothetical protein